MAKTIWGLIAIAIMTGTAVAQPGATPPTDRRRNPVRSPRYRARRCRRAATAQRQRAHDQLLDQVIAKAEQQRRRSRPSRAARSPRAALGLDRPDRAGCGRAASSIPATSTSALTFGLGFEKFKVPVLPDMETLRRSSSSASRRKRKDRDQGSCSRAGQPDPLELEQRSSKQVYEDVRKEILGLENTRGKRLERPAYHARASKRIACSAPSAGSVARAGIGVWKLTLGASASVGRVCRGECALRTTASKCSPAPRSCCTS